MDTKRNIDATIARMRMAQRVLSGPDEAGRVPSREEVRDGVRSALAGHGEALSEELFFLCYTAAEIANK